MLLAIAFVLAMLMPAAQAGASVGQGSKTKVPFITHGHTGSSQVSDRDCPPPPEATTQVALKGRTEFGAEPDDTFVGSDEWEACFYLKEDGSVFAFGETQLDGTFSGCGTGTLRFRYVATITAPDPETGLRRGTDRAVVIPGSGTGDLAGVRKGGYVANTTIAPDLSVSGPAEGYLYC